MFKNIVNKIPKIIDLKDETTIIFLYRYFSLALTSLFYLLSNPYSPLKNKIIVVVCLTTASIILNSLYIKNRDEKKVIKVLLVIEILGNIIILIPTGGLKSPYIWYALNTVLVTLSFLDAYLCWINMALYLTASMIISDFILNKESEDFIKALFENSNLILSFILVTVSVQLLFKSMNKLRIEGDNLKQANTQLSISNERIKESIEHILSLYQAVHSFANYNRKDKLIAIIVDYTEKITKSNLAFFCTKINQHNWSLETSKKDINLDCIFLDRIKTSWDSIKESSTPLITKINDINYMVIDVKSAHVEYGVLGIEINNNQTSILYKDILDEIRFLSDLSSIALDKLQLEEVNEDLLLSEEQNRIATEIHDSVSQRLFSISCCIHDLIAKGNRISEEQLTQELKLIKGSLKNAMKDLRETIYGLSWKKGGINMFKLDIENYLDEVSNLNSISISFNATGNEDVLSYDLKKAIYRIICEGTSNAIRHGKCSKIEIDLEITNESILLNIADNGKGFCYEKMDIGNSGLGVNNMVNLVNSFNGEIDIRSEIEKGTTINILFNKIFAVNRRNQYEACGY